MVEISSTYFCLSTKKIFEQLTEVVDWIPVRDL